MKSDTFYDRLTASINGFGNFSNCIYICCFHEQSFHGKSHYAGQTAKTITERTESHLEGTGALLIRLITEEGIPFKISAVYSIPSDIYYYILEQMVKETGHIQRFCGCCSDSTAAYNRYRRLIDRARKLVGGLSLEEQKQFAYYRGTLIPLSFVEQTQTRARDAGEEISYREVLRRAKAALRASMGQEHYTPEDFIIDPPQPIPEDIPF